MTTLEKLIKATIDHGLVADEHKNDTEYIKNMLVDGMDFRNVLDKTDIKLTYYCGLSETDVDGYWNELRYENIIIDIDAPNEITVSEWADYIDEQLENDEHMVELNNLASENKNMALAFERLGYTQEQISEICS